MIDTLPDAPDLDFLLLGDREGKPGEVLVTPLGRLRIVRREGIWAAVTPDDHACEKDEHEFFVEGIGRVRWTKTNSRADPRNRRELLTIVVTIGKRRPFDLPIVIHHGELRELRGRKPPRVLLEAKIEQALRATAAATRHAP